MKISSRSLADLRSGKLNFGEFARRYREIFNSWAYYFIVRYRPTGIDAEDLAQEGLIEAWRSVDLWEDNKSSLVAFVEYRVGERMQRECLRVLGWPKKGRKEPLKQIDVTSFEYVADKILTTSPVCNIEFENFVNEFPNSFHRDILIGIKKGASVKVVADYIYSDPERRLMYLLDSPEDAIRKVRNEVNKLTIILESERL
jgi:hypothetical protein